MTPMMFADEGENLDRTCVETLPQLKWQEKAEKSQEIEDGFGGILPPEGVQSEVRRLADVSQQLILEKALTDHAFLNHLHAILLFGPDGKNVLVNALAAACCEANSLDRTTAERFLQGIGPYTLEEHPSGVSATRQGSVRSVICLPLPQKRHMTIDSSSIDGPDGKYLFLILSDFTRIKELEILKEHLSARKKAEEALQENKARYNDLVRRIPIGVFTLRIRHDDSMFFEYGSPKLCQILGLHAEALRRDATLFFAQVHPEDRHSLIRTTHDVAASLKPLRWEGRFVVRKETRWCRMESEPLQVPGGESLWNGVISDITELKLLEETLEKALKEIKELKGQLEAESIHLREKFTIEGGPKDIIGISNPLKYVLYRIQQVAGGKTTVLLTGETGTGKGLVARFLHQKSDRRDKPFVNVNCAGLPPNLIESELFGREKGAFTGSTARQIGRFELANGGTIFLDEIGEIPLELQAKLLKIIEDGEFERLGSPRPVKVDVRIIASTDRNLTEEIQKGRFRKDLFYRLNVFPITIPPLRERREDIPLLAKFYAERFSKSFGKAIKRIPTNTMKVLENYSWPGNVRELMHVIERAVILSDGPELQLAEKIGDPTIDPDPEKVSKSIEANGTKSLVDVEREHIRNTLRETAWRIEGSKGAAQLLGMNPSTLRARMRKFGIKKPEPAITFPPLFRDLSMK